AEVAGRALRGGLDDAKANRAELRDEVIAFRAKSPGVAPTAEAHARLAALPSPLDKLALPDTAKQWWTVLGQTPPPSLVGMIGDPRRRPGGSSWHVEFSPDGKAIACAADYGGCAVWSTEPHALLAFLPSGDDAVTVFRFSPDRKHVATAHRSGTVRIWDLTTRKADRFVVKHESDVWGLAYSPDGRFLASGANDGVFKVWDSQTDQIVHSDKHPNWVHVAFSPDGKTLASFGPGWEASKPANGGLAQ